MSNNLDTIERNISDMENNNYDKISWKWVWYKLWLITIRIFFEVAKKYLKTSYRRFSK